jgi:hypothetical protein
VRQFPYPSVIQPNSISQAGLRHCARNRQERGNSGEGVKNYRVIHHRQPPPPPPEDREEI